jgi:hypothetical protein
VFDKGAVKLTRYRPTPVYVIELTLVAYWIVTAPPEIVAVQAAAGLKLLPPTELMTPLAIVIVVPSGFTKPRLLVVAVGTEITPEVTSTVAPSGLTTPYTVDVATGNAGAPSDRIKVGAEPAIGAVEAVAVGVAPTGLTS